MDSIRPPEPKSFRAIYRSSGLVQGAVFDWIEQDGHSAVTSTITMTELLVHPHREADETRINAFWALLTTYPNLSWVALDLEIAGLAAQFRARHGLRTPDAIHAATAIRSAATCYFTNNAVFKRVEKLETVLFDDLLA